MHTRAAARLDAGKTVATLSDGKARLVASILSPENATFEVMEARPLPASPNPPMRNRNEGVRKLAIHLQGANDLKLAVLLVPLSEGESAPKSETKIAALSAW